MSSKCSNCRKIRRKYEKLISELFRLNGFENRPVQMVNKTVIVQEGYHELQNLIGKRKATQLKRIADYYAKNWKEVV